MPVTARFQGELADAMLRRLKKELDLERFWPQYRAHESFVPRSERQRAKSNAARRRMRAR